MIVGNHMLSMLKKQKSGRENVWYDAEAADGNEKWGVKVGAADKKWGPRTRKSGGQLTPWTPWLRGPWIMTLNRHNTRMNCFQILNSMAVLCGLPTIQYSAEKAVRCI